MPLIRVRMGAATSAAVAFAVSTLIRERMGAAAFGRSKKKVRTENERDIDKILE